MRQKLKREETGGADRRQVVQKGDRRCRKETGGAGRGYRDCREKKQMIQREEKGGADKGDRK
jgi:hypothetical protein